MKAHVFVNRGSELGALVKCLKPFVPVVLIADDDRLPGESKDHVDIVTDRADIVIDRADFDVTRGRLVSRAKPGSRSIFPAMV